VNIRRCGFGPLTVEHDEHVLEPRPWTYLQATRAAGCLEGAPAGMVVELHCGAGHIGQATAALTGRPLVQVDDAATACCWAAHNARRNGIASGVVRADIGTMPFRAGCAALVLADPPYVPTAETHRFPEDPLHAIDGGDDGLEGFRTCLPAAARLLRTRGFLVLQVRGEEQAAAVAALSSFVELGLEWVDVAVSFAT